MRFFTPLRSVQNDITEGDVQNDITEDGVRNEMTEDGLSQDPLQCQHNLILHHT